jgi:hypothetical protein
MQPRCPPFRALLVNEYTYFAVRVSTHACIFTLRNFKNEHTYVISGKSSSEDSTEKACRIAADTSAHDRVKITLLSKECADLKAKNESLNQKLAAKDALLKGVNEKLQSEIQAKRECEHVCEKLQSETKDREWVVKNISNEYEIMKNAINSVAGSQGAFKASMQALQSAHEEALFDLDACVRKMEEKDAEIGSLAERLVGQAEHICVEKAAASAARAELSSFLGKIEHEVGKSKRLEKRIHALNEQLEISRKGIVTYAYVCMNKFFIFFSTFLYELAIYFHQQYFSIRRMHPRSCMHTNIHIFMLSCYHDIIRLASLAGGDSTCQGYMRSGHRGAIDQCEGVCGPSSQPHPHCRAEKHGDQSVTWPIGYIAYTDGGCYRKESWSPSSPPPPSEVPP